MRLFGLLPLLCLSAALSGCGSDNTTLDDAGQLSCQDGFLAGAAQLTGRPDVESFHLISAYQASSKSQTKLLVAWRNDHATLGTSVKKTQQVADDAVRVLLNVCRSAGFTPSAPSAPAAPVPSPSPTP